MSEARVLDTPRKTIVYNPKGRRHPVCRQLDLVLESIIVHQDSTTSDVGTALRAEFGESLFACLMQAAGIRRMRHHHELRHKPEPAQETTGAPAPAPGMIGD